MLAEVTPNHKYILLAEDNPGDVQLVREALEDRSILCHLQVVSDGERAVHFIEQLDRDSKMHCPELLLLDLYLPKLGGEHILQRLRSSERCAQTPVVVMSSSDRPSDMESAVRHAAVHYFRKPATLDEYLSLGDVVKKIVERRAPSAACESSC